MNKGMADKAGQHHSIDITLLQSLDGIEDVELSGIRIEILIGCRMIIIERMLFEDDLKMFFIAIGGGGGRSSALAAALVNGIVVVGVVWTGDHTIL